LELFDLPLPPHLIRLRLVKLLLESVPFLPGPEQFDIPLQCT